MRTRLSVAVAAVVLTAASAACTDNNGGEGPTAASPSTSHEVDGLQVDLPVIELAQRSDLVVLGTVEKSPERTRVADGTAFVDSVPVRIEQTLRGPTPPPAVIVGSFAGFAGDTDGITTQREGGDSHQQGVAPLRSGKHVLLFLSAGTQEMAGIWILSGGSQSIWFVDDDTAERLAPTADGRKPTLRLADAVRLIGTA